MRRIETCTESAGGKLPNVYEREVTFLIESSRPHLDSRELPASREKAIEEGEKLHEGKEKLLKSDFTTFIWHSGEEI